MNGHIAVFACSAMVATVDLDATFKLSKKMCTQKGAFSIQGVSEFEPSTKNVHFFLHTMYPNKCTFLVLGSNSDTVLLRDSVLFYSGQAQRKKLQD